MSAAPFHGSRLIEIIAWAMNTIEHCDHLLTPAGQRLVDAVISHVSAAGLLNAFLDYSRVKHGAMLGLSAEEYIAAKGRWAATLMNEMIELSVNAGEEPADMFADILEQSEKYANGEGRRH